MKDTKDAFGRRHECCRIISALLNKYLNDLGTISPLDDSDCSNKCDSQLNLSNSSESATRVTRASSTFIKSFEKICFVCIDVRESDDNSYNSGGLVRCALNSASANIVRVKYVFLQDENHKFHTAAQRVNILLSSQSHDVHAADIYYHQSCYLRFVCNRPKKNVRDDAARDEQSVLTDCFTSIQLNILRDENAYLLTQLLDDWIYLCDESGIITLTTRTIQLRRKIEERFPDEIGFCRSGIYVIVHNAWLNPCSYSVATLISAGLRDIDLCKGFAVMIKRKVSTFASSSKLPYTPDALLEEITEVPMKDLYNIIYLTVKGVCKVNKFGFAGTHSRTLATKIWSL